MANRAPGTSNQGSPKVHEVDLDEPYEGVGPESSTIDAEGRERTPP